MNEHDHDALDALRRIDGPADLGDGVEERLEAQVLARFDERVERASSVHERPTVVALEPPAGRVDGRRPNRVVVAVATAAAVVVAIVGLVAIVARDRPAPSDPLPPTTFSPTEHASVRTQLSDFCDTYIAPVRDADALWRPTGQSTEAQGNVLIAVEQAAQAMSELEPPLGPLLTDTATELLDVATNARLAAALNDDTAADALIEARDLLYAAPSSTGLPELPATCSAP